MPPIIPIAAVGGVFGLQLVEMAVDRKRPSDLR
jgi:hypothetical protein